MKSKSIWTRKASLALLTFLGLALTTACAKKDDAKTGVEGNISNDGSNVSTNMTISGYSSNVTINGINKEVGTNATGVFNGSTYSQPQSISFNIMINGQAVRIAVQPSFQGYAYTYANTLNTQFLNGLLIQSEARCSDVVCNGMYIHVIIRTADNNQIGYVNNGYNYYPQAGHANAGYMVPKEIGIFKIVDQNRVAAVWERQTGEAIATLDQVVAKLESIKN